MAAPSKHVVNTQFCIDSTTRFVVRKKPAVLSIVGGRWIIQDSERNEKFTLEEFAKEPGLALKDIKGKLILTVKPEEKRLKIPGKNPWNVFSTMESVLEKGKNKLKAPEPLFTVETSRNYSKIEVSVKGYTIEGSFAKTPTPLFKISHLSGAISCTAAEVTLNNQVEGIYDVEVKTGYDQAFIFGLVAVFEQYRKRLTKK